MNAAVPEQIRCFTVTWSQPFDAASASAISCSMATLTVSGSRHSSVIETQMEPPAVMSAVGQISFEKNE